MKYKLILDDNNYLTGFVHTGTEEDIYELNASEMNLEYLNCYNLVKNKVVFDEEKYNALIDEKTKEEEINKLKAELSSTDYQAIKYSEGWFTEEEYAPIKTMRENLRQQIRELLGE